MRQGPAVGESPCTPAKDVALLANARCHDLQCSHQYLREGHNVGGRLTVSGVIKRGVKINGCLSFWDIAWIKIITMFMRKALQSPLIYLRYFTENKSCFQFKTSSSSSASSLINILITFYRKQELFWLGGWAFKTSIQLFGWAGRHYLWLGGWAYVCLHYLILPFPSPFSYLTFL